MIRRAVLLLLMCAAPAAMAAKWVKIDGWYGPEEAKQEILAGVANYEKEAAK